MVLFSFACRNFYMRPIFRFFFKRPFFKALQIISKYKAKSIVVKSTCIKLELGAGEKKGENGWTTLDFNRKVDLTWDLLKGIPFPDNSVDTIYSSHLFEHFGFSDINKLLAESRRVLKENGEFLICVPNAEMYIKAYVENTSFSEISPTYFKPAFNNTTKIDMLNYIAYMNGDHKYMFDKENLLYLLKSCGFKNVSLRNFNPEVDLEKRHYESIYAVGYK